MLLRALCEIVIFLFYFWYFHCFYVFVEWGIDLLCSYTFSTEVGAHITLWTARTTGCQVKITNRAGHTIYCSCFTTWWLSFATSTVKASNFCYGNQYFCSCAEEHNLLLGPNFIRSTSRQMPGFCYFCVPQRERVERTSELETTWDFKVCLTMLRSSWKPQQVLDIKYSWRCGMVIPLVGVKNIAWESSPQKFDVQTTFALV